MRRLSSHVVWSIAGSALPAAAALLTIPFLLHSLDYQLFSMASLLLSLALFFFVYDFGIGRTVTYFTARHHDGDSKVKNALFSEALFWSLLISILAALIVVSVSDLFVTKWLKTTSDSFNETVFAFKIAAWGIPASIFAHLLRGLLEGHQDFRLANICKMVSGASLFLAPSMIVAVGHATLVDISYAIMASRYLALLIYLIGTARFLQRPQGPIVPSRKSPFFSYGIWTAVAGFISSMFVYGDRFVVAGYLDPQALSAYVASQDILIRYLLVPWAMATVLLPSLTQDVHSKPKVAAMYRAHQGRVRWFSGLFLALVLMFVWGLTPSMSPILLPGDTRMVVSLQALGIYFCALAQLPLIYLYAANKPRLIAFIFIFEALIYITIAPFIFKQYSTIGACLIWSGRLLVEYLLLTYWARRSMQ